MVKFSNILFCFFILPLLLVSCSSSETEVVVKSYPLPTITVDAESGSEAQPLDIDEIKLAAGDVLTIQVWGQEELDKQIILDSTGSIYFPFVGRIYVSGMTILQLQQTLTEKLSVYYVDPVVTVSPEKLTGQKYYMLGEVRSPGEFVMTSKMIVLNAVAGAGGVSVDADDVIILFRKEERQLLVMSIPLEYKDVDGNHLPSLMMQIHVGDVLYVPPSGIADVERFMMRISNIVAPILEIERGVLLWPALVDAIEGTSTQVIVN